MNTLFGALPEGFFGYPRALLGKTSNLSKQTSRLPQGNITKQSKEYL
ncbi:hypothetical protein GJV77_09245 [Myroides pelagicus]|uniref:Uncharacterized protein n=1 Tax=Myroides pelagicus TaxID=270914 RepID=A0A7K1GNX8_9FLAO|nr:hypothetical protein [Myroides pelagicus]MTH30093.1 hypothetical protein [Myroides pelagicus]